MYILIWISNLRQQFYYRERYAQQGSSVDMLGPVSTSDGVPEPSQKIVVFASTARIIHQFIGGPSFETLFTKYEQMPGYQLEPPGTC